MDIIQARGQWLLPFSSPHPHIFSPHGLSCRAALQAPAPPWDPERPGASPQEIFFSRSPPEPAAQYLFALELPARGFSLDHLGLSLSTLEMEGQYWSMQEGGKADLVLETASGDFSGIPQSCLNSCGKAT